MRANELKYLCKKSKFEMPDFQQEFRLSYSVAKKKLDEWEKRGFIKLSCGFTYEVKKNAVVKPAYVPKNETEAFCLKVLWSCIQSGRATILDIQHNFLCGYAKAAMAIRWMEKEGYISAFGGNKVRMSRDEYVEKFGDPLKQDRSAKNKNEKREKHNGPLHARIKRADDDDDEDDGENSEESFMEFYDRFLKDEQKKAKLFEANKFKRESDDFSADEDDEDDDEDDEDDDYEVDDDGDDGDDGDD